MRREEALSRSREIAFGAITSSPSADALRARRLAAPDLYDEMSQPIPAVPAHETRVDNIDTEFARAYRATKTAGKADEKVKMAKSLEWLENCDDGTVIRFTKTFPGPWTDGSSTQDSERTVHVLTFAAIRWGAHWFATFDSNKQSRMTTTSFIIWLLSGFPVTEIEVAKEWSTLRVSETKVIEEESPANIAHGVGCPVCDKHFETREVRQAGWKIPLHIKLNETSGTCAGSGRLVSGSQVLVEGGGFGE